MSATQAPNAEFIDSGKPVAQPYYQVDATGAPVTPIGGSTSFGSASNPLATNQLVGTPVYATTTLASGATANVSLPATSGKTTYLNGFYVSVAHTSAGVASGQVTVSFDGGTTTHMNFTIAVSTTYPGLVNMDFPDPIPAKSPNTTIVITSPTLTNAGNGSITAFGYEL